MRTSMGRVIMVKSFASAYKTEQLETNKLGEMHSRDPDAEGGQVSLASSSSVKRFIDAVKAAYRDSPSLIVCKSTAEA